MIEGFSVGPFFFRFYGIAIILGAMAAAWLAGRLGSRRGLNPEIVWDMLPWLLIGGIIGARLWHVFTPTPTDIEAGRTTTFYLTHPLDLMAVWNGGLGIPGAVIGGMLALWIYCRNNRQNFITWLDLIAPGLALAQAVGRWGNYFNQELYGAPTNLPWAIYIEDYKRLPEFYQYDYYHPLFLYECIWNLLTMGLLLWIGRRFESRLKPGSVFLVYLIAYPVGRFLLEFLRLNPSQVGGVNINQTFMAVIAVLSVAMLYLRQRGSVSLKSPVTAESVGTPAENLADNGADKPKE
jgi:phosphatidylglycerol---prolipoprotein diacylglyceryl transferase